MELPEWMSALRGKTVGLGALILLIGLVIALMVVYYIRFRRSQSALQTKAPAPATTKAA